MDANDTHEQRDKADAVLHARFPDAYPNGFPWRSEEEAGKALAGRYRPTELDKAIAAVVKAHNDELLAARGTREHRVEHLPNPQPEDEPPHGSVILLNGPTGTAWQRHYRDGLWHPTTINASYPWAHLLDTRAVRATGILVIHRAPDQD